MCHTGHAALSRLSLYCCCSVRERTCGRDEKQQDVSSCSRGTDADSAWVKVFAATMHVEWVKIMSCVRTTSFAFPSWWCHLSRLRADDPAVGVGRDSNTANGKTERTEAAKVQQSHYAVAKEAKFVSTFLFCSPPLQEPCLMYMVADKTCI